METQAAFSFCRGFPSPVTYSASKVYDPRPYRISNRGVSALERITDSSQTSREVRKVPTCDMNFTTALRLEPLHRLFNDGVVVHRLFQRVMMRDTTDLSGDPSCFKPSVPSANAMTSSKTLAMMILRK